MKRHLLHVACIQIAAGDHVKRNIARADRLLFSAKRMGVAFACLPEAFMFRGSKKAAEPYIQPVSGPLVRHFQKRACELGMNILLGSVMEYVAGSKKCYNTSVLINSKGKITATYRKRYLFDIRRRDVQASESKSVVPGRRDVVARVSGIRLGMAICYDIRFPEFLGRLTKQGAEIILLPANFTEQTGKAHWEVLCRARAIENQAFVIAPGQGGANPHTGMRAYGRSMIIDPWGKVLAKARGRKDEVVRATLDFDYLRKLRREFPTLKKRFAR